MSSRINFPIVTCFLICFFPLVVAGRPVNQSVEATTGVYKTFSVVFGAFNASNHRNNILLKWETLSETNSEFFEIQRNGHADDVNFYLLATISAAGNSNTRRQYSFTDESAQEGVHYYRLKQVDSNGQVIYSAIISIEYKPSSVVKRFLNPITTALFAEISSFDPNLPDINEWNIYNRAGTIIYRQRITSKTVYALVPALAAGIYLWEFRVNGRKQTILLFRQ